MIAISLVFHHQHMPNSLQILKNNVRPFLLRRPQQIRQYTSISDMNSPELTANESKVLLFRFFAGIQTYINTCMRINLLIITLNITTEIRASPTVYSFLFIFPVLVHICTCHTDPTLDPALNLAGSM